MIEEVRVPEIGENISSGEIASVLVKVGERVEPEQGLLELETDKAVVEMPAPKGGKVTAVLVGVGQKVNIGEVVVKLEVDASGNGSPQAATETPTETKTAERDAPAPTPAAKPASRTAPAPAPAPPASFERVDSPPPAAPSIRRFAREIGVDVRAVRGSGPRGRITVEDVKRHAKQRLTQPGGPGAIAPKPLPDFSRWGSIRREKLTQVRRITAETMAYAAATIPQVTQFEKADVTGLEDFRARFAREVEKRGGKLSLTVILIKVLAAALRRYPRFNSTIDLERGELILRDYVHISIAMDTPRGLLVPVLRDVDQKDLATIAVELGDLVQRGRDGKLRPEEFEGGGFSLSNQGPIGGEQFTPIVNPPQAAILGVSRTATEPAWIEGQVEPRLRLPLALSYDHRINDGADAARFLHWICEALAHPMALML